VVTAEEHEVPGMAEKMYANVEKSFSYDSCTKLHHYLTWYNVWRRLTFDDVYQDFQFFAQQSVEYLVVLYCIALCLCYRRGNLRLPSCERSFFWTLSLLISLVYFVVAVTFLVFCMKNAVFTKYKGILQKAKSPLSVQEHILFRILEKERTSCWAAYFGNENVITVIARVLLFISCNVFCFVAVFVMH
jgi:hypothetical protein